MDRCSVCGSDRLSPRWSVGGEAGADGLIPTTKEFGTALGDIVRCRACGHMQVDAAPPESELLEEYSAAASDDYIEEEAGQRASAGMVLDRVERHATRGPLVDLGCWVGFLVAEAEERGWDAVGIEPSRFASDWARRRGLDVRTEDLFTAPLPERHFQAVVLGDVIEHLERPGDSLERARSLLSPTGVLALMLPDSGSAIARALGRRWWSVIPTHLQYFTRHSIVSLLDRHDFEPVHVGTDPKPFTVRYYLEKTSGYSAAASGAMIRLAERAGVADRMWAPDLRDRMLVIAQPRERSGDARGASRRVRTA